MREAASLHFEFKRLTLLLFWAKNMWWEGWNGETYLKTTPVFKERYDAILRGNRSSGASLMAQIVENLPTNAGDVSLVFGSGRSPGERNGYPLQYSCLENFMDRRAWRAAVHGVAKSQTWLSDSSLAQHKQQWRLQDAFGFRIQISKVSFPRRLLWGLRGYPIPSCLWLRAFFILSFWLFSITLKKKKAYRHHFLEQI